MLWKLLVFISTVVFDVILALAFPFAILVTGLVGSKASEIAENLVKAGSRVILREPVTPFKSALPEDKLASVPVELTVVPLSVVVPEPTALTFEITADVIPLPPAPPPTEVVIDPALGAKEADVLVVVPSVPDKETPTPKEVELPKPKLAEPPV